MSRAQAPRKRSVMVEDYDSVMRHHRAAWRVERIGWSLAALVLAATLLGAFGDGPLSRAEAGSPQTLVVEYDRLQRSSAPSEYSFRVNPAMAPDGLLRLRFDQSLVEDMELESIVPEAEVQQAGSGYTEFVFRVAPGTSPVAIEFRYRPATFGLRRGQVSVAGAHAVRINQFAYP
jgi:hypothetical protein